MRVAVFGGSFNPPHIGHVLAVVYLLAVEAVDQVLVVPCFMHPLGKELAPFEHRFQMIERALRWLPDTRISRIEEELGGPSRTLRTLERLIQDFPDDVFRLVIGADLLLEGKRWHGFERVLEIAPPIVLGRAGVNIPEAPAPVLPEVSSTFIREALGRGDRDVVRPLVPRAVLEYISEHDLYAESGP